MGNKKVIETIINLEWLDRQDVLSQLQLAKEELEFGSTVEALSVLEYAITLLEAQQRKILGLLEAQQRKILGGDQ